MAEADDYLANLRSVGTNTSITAKPRQGIKMDPTDDAHTITHRPDASAGSGNLNIAPSLAVKNNNDRDAGATPLFKIGDE